MLIQTAQFTQALLSVDIGSLEHFKKILNIADFSLGKTYYGTTSKMTMCLN